MHVSRHEVPRANLAKRLEVMQRVLGKKLASVASSDDMDLSSLRTTAETIALLTVLTDPSSPEIARLLRIAARTGGALWALVKTNGGPIDVVIEDATPVQLQATIDRSLLHGGTWLACFWLATLVRDRAIRDTIVDTTVDFSSSQTQTHRYQEIFVEALRTFTRGRDPTPMVDAALAVIPTEDPWQRKLDRPMLAVAREIFARDATRADAALVVALESYRAYWSNAERADHSDGWISVPLTALTLIARDVGVTLTTTSDYILARI